MNDQVPPPPPRAGTGIGCFGTGCLILLGLLAFLFVAFIGGGFWALHHVQNKYSSKHPLTFANITSTEAADRTAQPEDVPVPNAPRDPNTGHVAPHVASAPMVTGDAPARWRAFEKAADHHQPARIELTADDINSAIADAAKIRNKAAVSIANNVARVQVSVPLDGVFMMGGRYLNGEATVEAAPDGDPAKARISHIRLGNESVSDDMIDRRLFGTTSIRGYINNWLTDKDINQFQIQNNRVIGQTGEIR